MLSFPDFITVKVMEFCKSYCSICLNTCLYLFSHLKYQQSSLQCFSDINIMVLSQKFHDNRFCRPVFMNCSQASQEVRRHRQRQSQSLLKKGTCACGSIPLQEIFGLLQLDFYSHGHVSYYDNFVFIMLPLIPFLHLNLSKHQI